eukprot:2341724-Prymnesium_polylepis.1
MHPSVPWPDTLPVHSALGGDRRSACVRFRGATPPPGRCGSSGPETKHSSGCWRCPRSTTAPWLQTVRQCGRPLVGLSVGTNAGARTSMPPACS